MTFLNSDVLINSTSSELVYKSVLFFIFGIIASILLLLQIILLSKLKLIVVKLLPLLSFCIAFENFVLFANTFIKIKSDTANTINFFHALEIPIFFIFLFEITLRLFEARSGPFCFIPFDMGEQYVKYRMLTLLCFVRGIAIGLFIINILINYDFIESNGSDCSIAGTGGYITLAQHYNCNLLWLALVPPIALSSMGIFIMIQIYRYGVHMTWENKKNDRWKLIIPGVLGQTIGQIWGTKAYDVTSNAGELSLLISVSILLLLIQRELASAASFAEYLHRSNIAFNYLDVVKNENKEIENRPASRSSLIMSRLGGVTNFLNQTEVDKKDIHPTEHVVVSLTSLDQIEINLDNKELHEKD